MIRPARLFVPEIAFNPHLRSIARHFGGIAVQPAEIPAATRFIFVCFTNRCGSNYLGQLLASGGMFRVPGENLNADTVINHAKAQAHDSLQRYFRWLVNHTKRHDVVTLKLAPMHIEVLGRAGILDEVAERSKFIVIERCDKLGQAISQVIAFQTGKFMSSHQGRKSETELVFQRASIDRILAGNADAYRQFEMFFGCNGIIPAKVIYEQLVLDPVQAMRLLAQQIGYPEMVVKPEAVRISRQAGALNAAWRALYLEQDAFDRIT
jgi:LPS sulfotransferase NodH